MSRVSPYNEITEELGQAFYDSRSEEDFNKLYAHLYPKYRNTIRKNYTKDKYYIDVILNETFHNIYFYIHNYNPKYNFRNYFYTMMQHEAFQALGQRNTYNGLNTSLEAYKKNSAEYYENRFRLELFNLDAYDDSYLYLDSTAIKKDKIIEIFRIIDKEHLDMVIDRYINGLPYSELDKKYGYQKYKSVNSILKVKPVRLVESLIKILSMDEETFEAFKKLEVKARAITGSYYYDKKLKKWKQVYQRERGKYKQYTRTTPYKTKPHPKYTPERSLAQSLRLKGVKRGPYKKGNYKN